MGLFFTISTNKILAQCRTIDSVQLVFQSASSLAFQWVDIPASGGYEVGMRPKGSLQEFSFSNTLTNLTEIRVSECAAIEIKVRPLCTAEFSRVQVFETKCRPCDSQITQAILATHPNSIVLEVQVSNVSPTGEDGILLEFRVPGQLSMESIFVSADFRGKNKDTVEITGLRDNTDYEAQVRHVCVQNNFFHKILVNSAPSPIFSFHTPRNCPSPVNIVSQPGQDTALISWNNIAEANGYFVDFRKSGTSVFSRTRSAENRITLNDLEAGTTYELRILSDCNGILGNSSPQVLFTTQPPPCGSPVNLTTSSITETTSVISWASVPFASSYEIEYLEDGGTVIRESATTNSKTLTGLRPGTLHRFRVQANCSGNKGSFSGESVFTTLVSCVPPAGVKATEITHKSAIISWDAVPEAISYNCRFRKAGDTLFTTLTTAGLQVELNGLSPSAIYEIQLQSVCQGNLSSQSPVFRFTSLVAPPCIQPTGFLVSSLQPFSAVVNWIPVTGAVSYNIRFRKKDAADFTLLTVTAPNRLFSNLLPETTYEIEVQTVCELGSSSFSNLFSFTTIENCLPPSNLRVSNITFNSALVEWEPARIATGYVIQFKLINEASFSSVSSNGNAVTLTGLQPSGNYTVKVQANCPNSNSPFSREISFTTTVLPPCNAPTGIVASQVSTNSALINWQPAEGATGYSVRFGIKGSAVPTVLSTANSSIALINLLPATEYDVQVQTNCPLTSSPFSPPISLVTLIPCVTPKDLKVLTVTHNNADLSWIDTVGATGYKIVFGVAGGSPVSKTVTGNAASLSELLPSTTYEASVQAICISGNSSFSNTVRFTTGAVPLCNPPTGLTALQITTSTAVINWLPVEGAGTYTVRARVKGGSALPVQTVSAPVISFSNLLPSTEYELEVQANCSAVSSISSDLFAFSTLAPCLAPTGLQTTSVSHNSAELSWEDAAGANQYKVFFNLQGRPASTMLSATHSATLTGLLPNSTYEVKVQSVCQSVVTTSSTLVFITNSAPPCIPPTAVAAGQITPNSAVLSWQPVPGALSYLVKFTASGSGAILTQSTSSTTLLLPNLLPATGYECQVQTVCDAGPSELSPVIPFNTTPLCGLPADLTVESISTNTAFISWSAIPFASGYNLQFRKISEPAFTNRQVSGSSLTLEGLSSNTDYEVKVQAVCPGGNSAFSASRNFRTETPCDFPHGFLAASITQTSALLSWGRIQNAIKINIETRKAGESTFNVLTAEAAATTKQLEGLSPGTTYEARIRSICINGNSPFSEMIRFTTLPGTIITCATPDLPVASAITASSATINWNTTPGAVRYRVRIRAELGVRERFIISETSSVTLTDLIPDVKYSVSVLSLCAPGPSEFSREVEFRTTLTPCPSPANLSVKLTGRNILSVSFNHQQPYQSYVLRYKQTGTANWMQKNFATNPFSITVSQLGLQPGKEYEFQLGAVCSEGRKSVFTNSVIISTPR